MIDIDVFISKCEKDIDSCFDNLKHCSENIEALCPPHVNSCMDEWKEYEGRVYISYTVLRDNIGEIKHLQECINSAEIMRTQMTQWKTVESQSKKFEARIKK